MGMGQGAMGTSRLCYEAEEIYRMANRAERDFRLPLAARLIVLAPKAEWPEACARDWTRVRAGYLEEAQRLYREVYG